MSTTQPIREKENLKKFMEYYEITEPMPRNQALIVMGLNTALRISDILNLKWEDVYDFEEQHYLAHVNIHEKKTGKFTSIALNEHVQRALEQLRNERATVTGRDYIFTKNTDYSTPLCRSQAFRIVKNVAHCTGCDEHISCHSLRKTFGYHAWKVGTPPALLMDIYNHSSYRITKKYLGIEQDERDAVFMNLELYK